MAKVGEIAASLDEFAPRRLAESWDNVGLLAGDPQADVSRVLATLDVTAAHLDEAGRCGAELLVAFHPLIFKPLARIVAGEAAGGLVQRVLVEQRSVVVTHTALDQARCGTSDHLAAVLEVPVTGVLRPRQVGCQKLVVFVPADACGAVASAMAAAGAGQIGDYAECAFETAGTGSFRALNGANPTIGQVGRLERVAEVRLEMVVPDALAGRAVAAMCGAHPYEEVAYDLIPLASGEAGTGFGRVGELASPEALARFAGRVRRATGARWVRYAGDADRPVRRVALMGGSGAGLVEDAARAGADVLVTGDLKHHDALLARRLGLALVDPGHAATEQPAVVATAEWLRQRWPELDVQVSQVAGEPFAVAGADNCEDHADEDAEH